MTTSQRFGFVGRPARRRAGVQVVCRTARLVLALTVLSGCGQDSPQATVEGTLRKGGEPLDNCLVTFLPEAGDAGQASHSRGLTDRQGSYRLSFDNQQEGAAIGRHRVTVQDLSVSTGIRRRDHGAVDAEISENAPPPPIRHSRVPESYMSPADTPLRREVKPGHQTIDLDIK